MLSSLRHEGPGLNCLFYFSYFCFHRHITSEDDFKILTFQFNDFVSRTTSMRTMSALHSHAGSPKTGTLNSRDLNFGGILTSTSSGSRTLDRTSQDNAANVYRAANMQDQKITPTIPESTFRSYQLQSPSSGFPIQNTGALPGAAEPNHRVQNSSSPGVRLKGLL